MLEAADKLVLQWITSKVRIQQQYKRLQQPVLIPRQSELSRLGMCRSHYIGTWVPMCSTICTWSFAFAIRVNTALQDVPICHFRPIWKVGRYIICIDQSPTNDQYGHNKITIDTVIERDTFKKRAIFPIFWTHWIEQLQFQLKCKNQTLWNKLENYKIIVIETYYLF